MRAGAFIASKNLYCIAHELGAIVRMNDQRPKTRWRHPLFDSVTRHILHLFAYELYLFRWIVGRAPCLPYRSRNAADNRIQPFVLLLDKCCKTNPFFFGSISIGNVVKRARDANRRSRVIPHHLKKASNGPDVIVGLSNLKLKRAWLGTRQTVPHGLFHTAPVLRSQRL